MPESPEPFFWTVFSFTAGLIFYSRFYVQWIVSEIKRRSVVPVAFWYQGVVGSVMLLVWAIHTQSPLGALSQSVNVVPYTRNLIHIWREKGVLTKSLNIVANALAFGTALVASGVVVWIWYREYEFTKTVSVEEARETWFWLGVGVIGQILFASRFLIQWVITEMKQKSVIPASFWHVSVIAALLQLLTFAHREEWVYGLGMIATLVVYVRNIWLIHFGKGNAVLSEKK